MPVTLPSADLPTDAYWVIPGKLLAGPHPARCQGTPPDVFVDYLKANHVELVINLTAPDEAEDYSVVLAGSAQHLRFAISDGAVPPREEMVAILDEIDHALAHNKVIYVHCLAGLGRTGTVVGCCLARHGLRGESILDQIAWLRSGTQHHWVRSPETDEQRRFVENWPMGQ